MNLRTLWEPTGERELTGWLRPVVAILTCAITLYHVYVFLTGDYSVFTLRTIHVGSILVVCYLTYLPIFRKTKKFNILDYVWLGLALAVAGYYFVNWTRLEYYQPNTPGLETLDFVFGGLLLILLMEASWRSMGGALTILTLISVGYAYFGYLFTGTFYHSGLSVRRIIDYSAFGIEGVFGTAVGVSATYILLFVLFGSVTFRAGAGKFLTDMALALSGRSRGGPAKVAVLGSGLVGMITGSSAANVVITGTYTIPMMKKVGFKPHFAGAVEAVASNGGSITPPIMGSIIFIMADLIEMPYIKIAVAAAIPAFLYYLGIWVQVHLYSVKENLQPTAAADIPRFIDTLKRGFVFFLPLAALVALLFQGFSPMRAVLWSLPVAIVVSWTKKETRVDFKKVFDSLVDTIMTMRLIMLATALMGLITGPLFSTGLAGVFTSSIGNLTGDQLFLSLLLAAAVNLLLGLVASPIACYLLTALLLIKVIVQMGVPAFPAHMFSIYFATLSVITPPTGGTYYVAAGIAGAEPQRTGWAATRLAIAGFILPFFFVYHPALLLMGSPVEIVVTTLAASVSIILIGIGVEGWFLNRLNVLERVMVLVSGFLVLFMNAYSLISAVLFLFVLFQQWRRRRAAAAANVS